MTTQPPVDTSGFLRRWEDVVRRHAAADEEGRAAIVRALLDSGTDHVLAEWPEPDPAGYPGSTYGHRAARLACERDLVAASGMFDGFEYFLRNPHLWWSLCEHDESLPHFISVGWQQLRSPGPDFDLWWYWLTYLDPARDDLNPVVHWLAEGRHLGYPPVPEVHPPRPDAPAADHPRRVVLFAGYDPDGMVDDYVVAYLRELSRFADVYYLADCELEDGELDKLAAYTKGRWAIRHGCYDFGSYSMLARDLVGWSVVETYDELVLANDSCFLVRPFDEVFAAMERTPGDWWALQATYDVFGGHEQTRLGRRLRLDEVTDGMRSLGGRTHAAHARNADGVNVYDDRFHLGSYFVAFRSSVVADPEFRRRLDTVAEQSTKTNIVRKYEIGITRYLVLAGYRPATFVDGILPFHPVYRRSAFDLVASGFPLLKRQLLTDNPLDVPDLARWRTWLGAASTDADLDLFEDNVLRVASPWGLHRGFGIRRRADGTEVLPGVIGPEEFDEEDRWAPKHQHWWAFPVDPVTGRLEGSARAVFEAVRADASILKIVLTAAGSPRLGGQNVVSHPLESPAGQFYLLRAGQVFVSRGVRQDVTHPLSGDLHRFVLLGRGSPLLVFGAATPVGEGVDEHLRHNERVHDLDLTRAVVVGSQVQYRAHWRPLAAPTRRPNRWITGLPRIDLLLAAADSLPDDLRRQEAGLRELVGGRRLVAWVPDEAPAGAPPALGGDDLERLADLVEQRGGVLGVRLPEPVEDERLLDLSAERFPDVEMVLRVADVLASDHAPELLDFLVTDRPALCFAPDIDALRENPGLLHDLDDLLPGGVRRDPETLATAVAEALDGLSAEQAAAYARARDAMHDFRDGRSAARVARRVQETYLPIRAWLAVPDRQE